MSRSARTSGCRCRRRATRPWPAPSVLVNLSASNITIGKAEARRLLCGSQSSARHRGLCLFGVGPGRIDHRSRLGRPRRDLRAGRPARRDRRASRRTRPSSRPTSTSAASARSGLRNNGFADCAMQEGRAGQALPASIDFTLEAPAAGSRWSAPSSASPTCRPIRPSCATTATRPTTSRSRAWRSACSRAAPSTAIIGVSGGLDLTQALIVTCRAMDQLGLCRARTSSPTRCRASAPPTRPTPTPGG